MNVIEGILIALKDYDKRLHRLEVTEYAHPIINLGTPIELTIDTGVVTRTRTFHSVDTQGDAATDDLDTINGGVMGDLLVLFPANGARTVVVKDGSGNLALAGDCTLDGVYDSITLIRLATVWAELARSDNSA